MDPDETIMVLLSGHELEAIIAGIDAAVRQGNGLGHYYSRWHKLTYRLTTLHYTSKDRI